jgi:hypothetical protein
MRVLFDEAHSEAWTIRPELAERMQPAHPADASYAGAAQALRGAGFDVAAHTDGPLDAAALASADVVVIAHPSESRWERTTDVGSPRLSADELAALHAFVAAGGGLVVLGETEEEKYGANLDELLAPYGLALRNDTVQDYEHCLGAPTWVLAEIAEPRRGRVGDPLARVRRVCLYRATTLALRNGARVLVRAHQSATAPGEPLIATVEAGAGRVVVLADSDLFGDDCLGQLDHRELWRGLISWAAGGRRAAEAGRDGCVRDDRTAAGLPAEGERRRDHAQIPAPAGLPAAWERLREHTDALALLQSAAGALREGADRAAAAAHVRAIDAALAELSEPFAHQREYLAAAREDLAAWAAGGFAVPDFTASLERFRPDRERRDGARHLAFFPMYKQNGPRERVFEALVVEVPWPEWIARLERERFDNEKFVPVRMLACTRGYRSECAVLFPEMVSTAVRPANHFGAIFCDREAERLRRVAGAAADLLALNLPADAGLLLADAGLSEHAYVLWDLIHDRAHSHGELPFDPFMIRQRSPYWMYSLEELRCDLTAYARAEELEREGLGFARYVQYAILLDRLLRFPITGPRVRNYDGLGGQLLFAHLHRRGELRWEDNRLTVDWERVGEGVGALREEIATLYRDGIDRTKLAHWGAAHDLIASRVPPAAGSRWAAGVRAFPEREDPRPYVDEVLQDEFPLSLFYSQLRAKLADVLQAPHR